MKAMFKSFSITGLYAALSLFMIYRIHKEAASIGYFFTLNTAEMRYTPTLIFVFILISVLFAIRQLILDEYTATKLQALSTELDRQQERINTQIVDISKLKQSNKYFTEINQKHTLSLTKVGYIGVYVNSNGMERTSFLISDDKDKLKKEYIKLEPVFKYVTDSEE